MADETTAVASTASAATASAATETASDREDALLDRAMAAGEPDPNAEPETTLDSLARTDSRAGKPMPGPAPSKATPTDPAATTPPVEPAKPEPTPLAVLDDDIKSRLVDARLRVVPGETREQALTRLTDHYAGRSTAHYREIQEMRQEQTQLRQLLEPMLRTYYQSLAAKQQDELLSQIPDKETDPEGYRTWLLEQTLLRGEERETAEQEQARLAEEQEQEAADQEAEIETVLNVDEFTTVTLENAIANDPEVAAAYQATTRAMLDNLEEEFPDSTLDQRVQAAYLLQLRDMRKMVQRGKDIPTAIKAGAERVRKWFASGPPVVANGNGAAAAPVVPAPVPAPARLATSPTADRLTAQSQAAAARSVVAPTLAAPAPSGVGLDLHAISDEDTFVEMALDGRLPDDVRHKMLQDTYGKSSRWG